MKVAETVVRNLGLSLALSLFSFSALGDMFVDRSVVIFEAGAKSREDVKVSNTGEENIFVQIEVLEVLNPGTKDEKKITVSDPSKLKLIATPNKLVVPPGAQKLVRIVNLKPADSQEHIYRINVTPILPPLAEEASQLRIVVAYQVLTIVQAAKPKSNLDVVRSSKSITFTNQGNSNVLLSDGRQCESSEKCEELNSKRLYAGNSWILDLPLDAPVAYSVRSFDGVKKEVYR